MSWVDSCEVWRYRYEDSEEAYELGNMVAGLAAEIIGFG